MRARIALAAVLAVVALGIAAPAASATISLTPSSADFGVPMSCTIDVTFTPTAVGARTGTLSAAGQSSSLSGTGLALPVQPQAVDVKAAIRKCKKKFPKGPKRKKCIKRAKSLAY